MIYIPLVILILLLVRIAQSLHQITRNQVVMFRNDRTEKLNDRRDFKKLLDALERIHKDVSP